MQSRADLDRLSLGTIRCVREVLSCRSMTLAAERLRISQPAVSQHVARFERLSGIAVTSRKGNSLTVRDDAVADLVEMIVGAERSLQRIAEGDRRVKQRLGICDYIATMYCHNISIYKIISTRYEIHSARAADLKELFSRGDLDVVIRPLYYNESDQDLMTEVPITWVACQRADMTAIPDVLPVIFESSSSPYTYYAESALQAANVTFEAVARIDDHTTRAHFVAAGLGCTPVPAFLDRYLSPSTTKITWLPSPRKVRLAAFYNRKTTAYKNVVDLFDSVVSALAWAAGSPTVEAPQVALRRLTKL